MSFMPRGLTEEEQAINDAVDIHLEAKKDERNTYLLAIVLYFAGLFMQVLSDKDSRPHHIGTALLICAIVVFGVHLALGFRTRKYRYAAKALIDQYRRKQAIPFYNELTEMFAEKPGVHLHLNENGSITVTDKRIKEIH